MLPVHLGTYLLLLGKADYYPGSAVEYRIMVHCSKKRKQFNLGMCLQKQKSVPF